MERKLTTVDDLAGMTPAERHQNFEDSIVWDLAQLPPERLSGLRARFESRLAERDAQNAS